MLRRASQRCWSTNTLAATVRHPSSGSWLDQNLPLLGTKHPPLWKGISLFFNTPTKKSRNTKDRWHKPSSTSNNVNDKTSEPPVRRDDPVLLSPLNTFRNKKEIDEKVCICAEILGRDCATFHSGTVDDDYQVKVIRKALAYTELIIINSSKYNKVKGIRTTTGDGRGNIVQSYLNRPTLNEAQTLRKDAAHGEVLVHRWRGSHSQPATSSLITTSSAATPYSLIINISS
jgi:hypothetical protein